MEEFPRIKRALKFWLRPCCALDVLPHVSLRRYFGGRLLRNFG